jgi:hypothetical protein
MLLMLLIQPCYHSFHNFLLLDDQTLVNIILSSFFSILQPLMESSTPNVNMQPKQNLMRQAVSQWPRQDMVAKTL